MKIWHMAVTLMLAWALIGLAVVARAEPYNPEDKWIGRSIRSQADRDHVDHRPARRTYHAPQPRRLHREVSEPHHPQTRVYGIVTRRSDTVVRDATGHVECFPALEARSHERQSENTAWDDAQRAWQNTVRWKYGERFQNIGHASAIEKRCNVSTISESVAGKMIETARGLVTGDDNGRRWRCEVRANPCLAPVDTQPNVKGVTQ